MIYEAMKITLYLQTIICILLTSCLSSQHFESSKTDSASFGVKQVALDFFDTTRSRHIPVAFYTPTIATKASEQRIVIFSHGYGQNKGSDYLVYSYLTRYLASKGYFVVSVQHELATDSLMPMTGIPQVVRRPFWERGVENIFFVINELRRSHPDLDFKHIALVGHSNGGDISALFSNRYPNIVEKIITLDNRRMPLPRSSKPSVYSLRSSDQPADLGVLPSDEERKQYGITIIKLPNTVHNDMNDNATAGQRREINDYILSFLNDK